MNLKPQMTSNDFIGDNFIGDKINSALESMKVQKNNDKEIELLIRCCYKSKAVAEEMIRKLKDSKEREAIIEIIEKLKNTKRYQMLSASQVQIADPLLTENAFLNKAKFDETKRETIQIYD